MRKLLTGLFVAALWASPAQAQTTIQITCTSVTVTFRTSVQADSAKVEIQSNAGTETHAVTLVQGGADTVTFPLDGQLGEAVVVTVSLVYGTNTTTSSATETLSDCLSPSPSPSPQPIVEPSPEPTPFAGASPTAEAGVTPGASSVSANDDIDDVSANADTDNTTVIAAPSLPAELPRTGIASTLIAIALSLIAGGLTFRFMGGRISRRDRG